MEVIKDDISMDESEEEVVAAPQKVVAKVRASKRIAKQK